MWLHTSSCNCLPAHVILEHYRTSDNLKISTWWHTGTQTHTQTLGLVEQLKSIKKGSYELVLPGMVLLFQIWGLLGGTGAWTWTSRLSTWWMILHCAVVVVVGFVLSPEILEHVAINSLEYSDRIWLPCHWVACRHDCHWVASCTHDPPPEL